MNLLIRDLKYQIKKIKFTTLAMILIYSFMIFLANMYADGSSIFEHFFKYSFIDAGMVRNLNEFFIPSHWLLLHLIPVSSLILIIIKDHYDNGIYSLIKVKNKTTYFYSKIIASSIINLILITLFIVVLFIWEKFSNNYNQQYTIFFTRIMFCLILENIILTFLGVLVALKFSTRFSLFFLLLNLSLAMLTNFPYIIGQASLGYKQDFLGGEFKLTNNIIYLLVVLAITVIFSYFYFSKYNFYGDEKW